MTLRELLLNNDTQRSAATKIGISEGMVSLILAGKRNPSLRVAKRIAEIYKCDLNTIYFYEEDQHGI
jgi:DNA-binding XRE family transcriptional regulator|tara:strand:- start:1720 stop:1920 length:201 start_codon:yes stop_codon:yes gene_type:complete